jgi:hypothetical protein
MSDVDDWMIFERAIEIADEAARETIESMSLVVLENDMVWRGLYPDCLSGDGARREWDRAVEYLVLRGLAERSADGQLVRLVEATP